MPPNVTLEPLSIKSYNLFVKITFNYSIERELKRVQDTIRRKDFFQENGYQPTLPEDVTFENFNLARAKERIKNEFDESLANEVGKKLKTDWEKHRNKIESFVAHLPYKKPEELEVIFTRYGMGGSYNTPNVILINLRNTKNPLFILVHELLHLIIEEPVVGKYQLSQSDKESLVDYLLNESQELRSIFPWTDYQEKAPSKVLLKKIGWDKLEFKKAKPRKKDPLVIRYSREVSAFFNLPEMRISIYQIQSRKEYNEIRGTKSENWMVGFTRGRTVFILDRDKFESESNHPKSDFELVLKHEISHIYYRQLKQNNTPAWLNEGTACYVAGQNKKLPKNKITIETLDKYHNDGGSDIYSIGWYMVDKIIEKGGTEKLFELIKMNNRKKRYSELKKMFNWLR